MLTYSLIAFAVAAVGGVTLAILRFSNKKLPFPLALGHGAIAATGLVLLIAGVVSAARPMATVALIVFLVAAVGGFTLISFHLRSKLLPIPLVIVHAAAAIIAFLLLISVVV